MEECSKLYKNALQVLNDPDKISNLQNYDELIITIKSDLLQEQNTSNKANALSIIRFFIQHNIKTIQKDVITILSCASLAKKMHVKLLKSVKFYVMQLVYSQDLIKFIDIYNIWKNFNEKQFVYFLKDSADTISESECNNNFIKQCRQFLITKILSKLIAGAKEPLLVEIGCMLAEVISCYDLTDTDLELSLQANIIELCDVINSHMKDEDPIAKDLFHIVLVSMGDRYINKVKSFPNWGLIKTTFEHDLKTDCFNCINNNELKKLSQFAFDGTICNKEKFTKTLFQLCTESESKNIVMKFYKNSLIPFIMEEPNLHTLHLNEDSLIDLAVQLSKIVREYTDADFSELYQKIEDYILSIENLKDNNSPYWYKLWIITIQFLPKVVSDGTITRRLLLIVERAFKSISIEQKMCGFDCWKELIKLSSLNLTCFTLDRQLKLLLTPLLAKFSKIEMLFIKKFEVFLYLMKKLDKRCVLVLDKYLQMALSTGSRLSDSVQHFEVKQMEMLHKRNIQVFLEILGHSHDINHKCLGDSKTGICKSILNQNNISNYYQPVIKAVYESSILLNDMELDEDKRIILKCLWTSLFKLIFASNTSKSQDFTIFLIESLDDFIKEEVTGKNLIIEIIFACLTNFSDKFVIANSLSALLKSICCYSLDPASSKQLKDFLVTLSVPENNKLLYQTELFKFFSKISVLNENIDLVAQMWQTMVKTLDDESKEKSLGFLTWPTLYMHKIEDPATKEAVGVQYEKNVIKYIEKCDDLHLNVFKSLLNILKANPSLIGNISSLILKFSQKPESKLIMNVTLEIYNLILTSNEEDKSKYEKAIAGRVADLYKTALNKIQDKEIIIKLNLCLEDILNLKCFNVLKSVKIGFHELPDKFKRIHVKYFPLKILLDLLQKESDPNIKTELKNLTDLIQIGKDYEAKFVAKIASVAALDSAPSKHYENTKPKSTKMTKKITPTKNTTPSKLKPSSVPIDEETCDKFVLIDSQVILPNILTDHQKEVLKKRHEDIPALYQDLSQSVSQSLDGIKEKVNNNNKENNSYKTSDNLKTMDLNATIENELKEMSSINDSKVADNNEMEITHEKDVMKSILNNPRVEILNEDNLVTTTPNSIIGSESIILPSIELDKTSKDISVLNNMQEPSEQSEKSSESLELFQTQELIGDQANSGPESNKKGSSKKNLARVLSKLKIDIVGGNEFCAAKLRTRKTEQKGSEDSSATIKIENKKGIKSEPKKIVRKQKQSTDSRGSDSDKVIKKMLVPSRHSGSTKASAKCEDYSSNKQTFEKKLIDHLNNETPTKSQKKSKRTLTVTPNSIRKSQRKAIPNTKLSDYVSVIEDKNLEWPNEFLSVSKNVFNESMLSSGSPATKRSDVEIKKRKKNEGSVKNKLDSPKYGKKYKIRKIECDSENVIESSQSMSDYSIDGKRHSKKFGDSLKIHIRKVSKSPQLENKQELELVSKQASFGVSWEIGQNTQEQIKKKRDQNGISSNKQKDSTSKMSRKRKNRQELNSSNIENSNCSNESKNKSYKIIDASSNTEIESQVTNKSDIISQSLKSPDLLSSKVHHQTESQLAISEMDTASIPIKSTQDETVYDFQESDDESTKIDDINDKMNVSDIIESQTSDHVTIKSVPISESADPVIAHSTQSQNTQTQEEGKEEDLGEMNIPVQLQLELPVRKCILTDSEIALSKMDTASVTLTSSENFNGFMASDILTEDPEIIKEINSKVINREIIAITSSSKKEEIAISEPMSEASIDSGAKSTDSNNSIASSPINNDTPNRRSELLHDTINISPINPKESSPKSSLDTSTDNDEPLRKFVPIALKFDEEDLDGSIKNKQAKEKRKVKIQTKDVNDDKNCADNSNFLKIFGDIGLTSNNKHHRERSQSKRKLTPFSKNVIASPSSSRTKQMMSNLSPVSPTDTNVSIPNEKLLLTFNRPVPSPLATPRNSILKRKHADDLEEGLSPSHKRKRVNFSDPCTTSEKIFIKDDAVLNISDSSDIDKEFLKLMAGDVAPPKDCIPTELTKKQEMKNITIRQENAIYPKLVGCQTDVALIVRTMSSPLFFDNIMESFKSKNITTIGDLAKQKRSNISHVDYTFSNVYQALDKYWNENKTMFTDKDSSQMEIMKELDDFLQRLQNENISQETICNQLFSIMDQDSLLSYVSTYFYSERKQLIDEKNYSELINHTINDLGKEQFCELVRSKLNDMSKLCDSNSASQVSEICLNKMKNDTWESFGMILMNSIKTEPKLIRKTLNSFSIDDLVKCLIKRNSLNDIVTNALNRGSPSKINYRKDLAEIYKLIGDKLISILPTSNLMQLSVDFQTKIMQHMEQSKSNQK